jgi:hypothetical protein
METMGITEAVKHCSAVMPEYRLRKAFSEKKVKGAKIVDRKWTVSKTDLDTFIARPEWSHRHSRSRRSQI